MTIQNMQSGEGEHGKTRAIGELRTESDRVAALIPATGGYTLTTYAVATVPSAAVAGETDLRLGRQCRSTLPRGLQRH